MKPTVTIVLCLSRRYWSNDAERMVATDELSAELHDVIASTRADALEIPSVVAVVESDGDVESVVPNRDGLLVLVPMSGAIQPWMLSLAERFRDVIIAPAYLSSIFSSNASVRALELNSSPAAMDAFAVIKRTHPSAYYARSREDLQQRIAAWVGVHALRGRTVLIVGDPEPWVISIDRDAASYERLFGVSIEVVSHAEMERIFRAVDNQSAEAKAREYASAASEIVEPTTTDLVEASRLVLAVEQLMSERKAMGMAIACFDLIGVLKTTSCLAVSMLNDDPTWIGACEGDLDAALTLMLVKAATGKSGWIANPNLQRDDTINFVHCTAALRLGGKAHPFRLRSHHESGVGVSPEVDLPVDRPVTLVRASAVERIMTLQHGTALEPAHEASCRTQLRVDLGGTDDYLRNVLGCHQVIVYDDVIDTLENAADYLGVESVRVSSSVTPSTRVPSRA